MNSSSVKLKSISFRSQLSGEIIDFCDSEKISCAKTHKALVQLVASLANYREEGFSLSPNVFVCNNARQMCSVLGGSELLSIGNGPLSENTVKQAFKKCAPLAIGGWAIFLERGKDILKYGLFLACHLLMWLYYSGQVV